MRFIILVIYFISATVSLAASPKNFSQSKRMAAGIFLAHPQTLYCNCIYQGTSVDLNSCGMNQAAEIKRAHRIEWEHMMAAEHFGQHFECWREPLCSRNGKPYKGRACCAHQNEQFRHIESELYNLWPAVGLINQARSNYRFAALGKEDAYYGCAITIDKSSRRVEPSNRAKGVVARAYLFMAEHYQLPLSDSQRSLFVAWNKQHPPDDWERQWAESVSLIEGYDNPYISNYELRR